MAPLTPLVNPAEYFAERRSPLAQGAAVFGINVLVGIASLSLVFSLLLDRIENLPAGAESVLHGMMGGAVVATFVVSLLSWAVVAAVMHFPTGGSSTDGTFDDALAVAGWAYAPKVLTAPIGLAYTYRTLADLSLDASDLGRLEADVTAAQAQIDARLFPLVLFVLATIWSVYILAKGVSATHDVTVDTAAIPAVVVGIGSVVLYLLN